MMPLKKWSDPPTADPERVAAMAHALDVPRAVAAVLLCRGIDETAAAAFLDPRLANLSDPFRLPDMQTAVDHLWQAIDAGERITVFGDYDADGITAAALAGRVLTALGGIVAIHLPHRGEEGYGLSLPSLRRCLRDTRPDLLLTVDCGSCSAAAVQAARRTGVATVVTDHHIMIESPAPDALAVVNPQRSDWAGSPDATVLAGVGIAFKLCHALVKQGRQHGRVPALEIDLRDYLELVALGTVADVVPLTGENRILVAAGIEQINRRPGLAVSALMTVAGTRNPVTSHQIAFALAPRLNAAGRLGDARTALNLLMADDWATAIRLAGDLDKINQQRRGLVETLMTAAETRITALRQTSEPFGIVIGDSDWHLGVVGIVASRIVQRYNRPTVVVSFDKDGHGRGSARSIDAFHLLDGLKSCADSLLTFGGHALAAGLSVHADAFDTFRHRFNQAGAALLAGRDLRPQLTIDEWLTPCEINPELIAALNRLAPFGEGNPQPVLGLRTLRLRGRPRPIGDGKHLKMMLECGATAVDTVGFNLGGRKVPATTLDIAFRPVLNEFRGVTSLQLHLQDFRAAGLNDA